jgi:hypothetical protein
MRRTGSRWDVALVELVGTVGAALAAAATLRGIGGTSTPYHLLVALALLKLPAGAMTAVLGLLLIQGGFIPGFTSLATSAQILAWAIVFGYGQQLITRYVDERAQALLARAGPVTTPRPSLPERRAPATGESR